MTPDATHPAKLTLIFGISGVGKTYTANQWATSNPDRMVVINASDVIRDAYPHLKNGDDIRQCSADVIVHDLLATVVDRLPALRRQHAGKTIIMPMHSVFENPDGVHDVPPQIISAMQPDQIYFIEEPPAVILDRRKNDSTRNRPCDKTVNEIAERQHRAKGNLEGFQIKAIKSGSTALKVLV